MTNIIQLDANELRVEIKNCLREAIIELKELPTQPEKPDKIGLNEALEHMKANGRQISKSKAYKMSMNGELPCEGRFGKRLILSRKKLDAWMDSQIVRISNSDDVMTERLAKAAQKKG